MKATVPDIAVFRDLLSKYRKDELLSRRSDIDPSVHPDHFDAVIAELDALFDGHPDHKQDGAKWRRLDNGWYMNAVLSEGAKLEMLKRFSRLAGFEEGAWTWNDKAAPPEYVDFF